MAICCLNATDSQASKTHKPDRPMTASNDAVQAEIIEDFALLENWQERYRHIIELGKTLPSFPDELRNEAHLVRGCQSRVWLAAELQDGLMIYRAASEALIVSGLVALLLRVYSGLPPATILATEPRFIKEIGLDQHLSMNRGNGLTAMVNAMRAYASQACNTA
jgi:cysteine desulfuration protein SufE